MKLSELVAYRTQLDEYNVPAIQRASILELENILHRVETSRVELGNYKQELKQNLDNINQQYLVVQLVVQVYCG